MLYMGRQVGTFVDQNFRKDVENLSPRPRLWGKNVFRSTFADMGMNNQFSVPSCSPALAGGRIYGVYPFLECLHAFICEACKLRSGCVDSNHVIKKLMLFIGRNHVNAIRVLAQQRVSYVFCPGFNL